ncbi:MAG: hypothetical protein ABL984_09755 [Pyrinomonadaceae bacterium]
MRSIGSLSALVLLSFVLLSLTALGQDHLLPAPPEIKVVEQPDSPVRLSITGVRKFDGQIRNIGLKIENLSGKGLVAVATRGMTKDEIDGQASWSTPLRSGHSAGLIAMSAKPIEGERSLLIDAAMFEDGTVWGEDKSGNGELFKGIRAGRFRLIADLTEQVGKGDEAALRAYLERRPYLPEYARIEKKTKFEEGFVRGYGAEMFSFQQDLKDRPDIGAVATRLAVLREQIGVSSRGKGKRIAKTFSIDDILKIERIEMDGRAVELNDEFTAGDDWMRGVVVTIKNASAKRIVSLTVNVGFPESTATGNMMMYSTTYGRRPGLRPEVKIAERPMIDPDSSVQISFGGEEFVRLTRFLDERHPLSQLSRAELGFGMIHFDDGTAWSMGNMMKPDPGDPNRWIPIGKAK